MGLAEDFFFAPKQGLRPVWVVIVVVRRMYILNVLAVIEQMCHVVLLKCI